MARPPAPRLPPPASLPPRGCWLSWRGSCPRHWPEGWRPRRRPRCCCAPERPRRRHPSALQRRTATARGNMRRRLPCGPQRWCLCLSHPRMACSESRSKPKRGPSGPLATRLACQVLVQRLHLLLAPDGCCAEPARRSRGQLGGTCRPPAANKGETAEALLGTEPACLSLTQHPEHQRHSRCHQPSSASVPLGRMLPASRRPTKTPKPGAMHRNSSLHSEPAHWTCNTWPVLPTCRQAGRRPRAAAARQDLALQLLRLGRQLLLLQLLLGLERRRAGNGGVGHIAARGKQGATGAGLRLQHAGWGAAAAQDRRALELLAGWKPSMASSVSARLLLRPNPFSSTHTNTQPGVPLTCRGYLPRSRQHAGTNRKETEPLTAP